MKEYLWEVVKNTGMFIVGISVIILYVVGLVLSVCISLLPMFVAIYLHDCMGFEKMTVSIPAFIITIPWALRGLRFFQKLMINLDWVFSNGKTGHFKRTIYSNLY